MNTRKFPVIPGQKFGRLTVIKEIEPQIDPDGGIHRRVKCLCDCGEFSFPHWGNLRHGISTSCGCFRMEKLRQNRFKGIPIALTHGMSYTSEYSSWRKMKARCYNPNETQFKDWGGRGISICDRWRDSFENFYSDMGPKPHGYVMDRINNDGNYEPKNCQWVTRAQSNKNRRSKFNRATKPTILTLNGVIKSIAPLDSSIS